MRIGRRGNFSLGVRLWYRIFEDRTRHEPWSVITEGYDYKVQERSGQTILTFYLHAARGYLVTYPLLHVGGRTSPVELSKVHVPTGRITLPAVVRMAITELGVEPLRGDWGEVLERAEAALSG